MFDQALLDPVREEIFEPGGLGGLFVADHNGLVPACPDLVGEIAHEGGELERVVDPEECVKVIGHRMAAGLRPAARSLQRKAAGGSSPAAFGFRPVIRF